MGYGYEVREINDRIVKATVKKVQLMGEIGLPGAVLVNTIPCRESSLVGVRQV
jgi:hypothetical protein